MKRPRTNYRWTTEWMTKWLNQLRSPHQRAAMPMDSLDNWPFSWTKLRVIGWMKTLVARRNPSPMKNSLSIGRLIQPAVRRWSPRSTEISRTGQTSEARTSLSWTNESLNWTKKPIPWRTKRKQQFLSMTIWLRHWILLTRNKTMLSSSWTKYGVNKMNLPYRLPVALEVLAPRLFQLELVAS